MNLKQRHLDRLREDRLTRHICPGVRIEDWILACFFRHLYLCVDLLSVLQPRYMSTATGRRLCGELHAFEEAHFLSLRELDRKYGAQAREHPEQARKLQALRDHIARLQRIPRGITLGDYKAQAIIRLWCEDRRRTLHLNRRRPTERLEGDFRKARERLRAVRLRLDGLTQRQERLYQAEQRQARRLEELCAELRLRPDRGAELDEVLRTMTRRPQELLSLRARLLYRVRNDAVRLYNELPWE